MRSPALFSLALLATPLLAQDLVLKPDWRKGDSRTLYLTETSRTFENGELIAEEQDRMDARVKVFNVEPHRWLLEVDMPNVVLRSAQDLSEALGADLDPWKRLQLRFTVDRTTGRMALLNWIDVREKITQSFEQIKRTLRKQDPEVLGAVEMALAPLLELYTDSATVTDVMTGDFAFLARAIALPLSLDAPLERRDTTVNPFDPKGPKLVSVEHLHLDAYDRIAGKATVRIVEHVDAEAFKAIARSSMQRVVEAMGTDKATRARAMTEVDKAINAMTMDVQAEETHELDTTKGWPVRVTRTGRALITAEGKERLVESQRNVEVR